MGLRNNTVHTFGRSKKRTQGEKEVGGGIEACRRLWLMRRLIFLPVASDDTAGPLAAMAATEISRLSSSAIGDACEYMSKNFDIHFSKPARTNSGLDFITKFVVDYGPDQVRVAALPPPCRIEAFFGDYSLFMQATARETLLTAPLSKYGCDVADKCRERWLTAGDVGKGMFGEVAAILGVSTETLAAERAASPAEPVAGCDAAVQICLSCKDQQLCCQVTEASLCVKGRDLSESLIGLSWCE